MTTYTLDSITLTAPRVIFSGGAVIRPASDATVLTISGLISAAPSQQIFDFPEVSEATATRRVICTTSQTVYPEWFGARASGLPDAGADDSWPWQAACDALRGSGGTVRAASAATYPLRYPFVVMGTNVNVDLNGSIILTDLARADRAPAGVCFIGNSREWNLAQIKARRIAADLFNFFRSDSFNDIGGIVAAGQTESNFARVVFPEFTAVGSDGWTASGCSVYNGKIYYYDDVAFAGNYGVQVNNAFDCHAYDIETKNTAQCFGFGSDMPPSTPYALGCTAKRMTVVQVNQTHTYYGAGFHGYARDCHDEDVIVARGAPDDTPDGNLHAFNYAADCTSTRCVGESGRGANGEGFWIGSKSRRCRVYKGRVTKAKRAFSDFSPLDILGADYNAFIDCTANDVDYLMAMYSKRARFTGIRGANITMAEILLANVNAAENVVRDSDISRVIAEGAWTLEAALAANDIA